MTLAVVTTGIPVAPSGGAVTRAVTTAAPVATAAATTGVPSLLRAVRGTRFATTGGSVDAAGRIHDTATVVTSEISLQTWLARRPSIATAGASAFDTGASIQAAIVTREFAKNIATDGATA